MKNLIKYGFIAVVSCFWACTTEVIVTKEEKEIIEREKAKEKQRLIESEYCIIFLDGCEYYVQHGNKRGYLSHKGNCKNPIHKCNCN